MVSVACLDDGSVVGVEAQLRRDVGESCEALRSSKMVGCFARVLIGGEGVLSKRLVRMPVESSDVEFGRSG